jgi:hypothetical protein
LLAYLSVRGALVLVMAAALVAVMLTPAKSTSASPGSSQTAIVSLFKRLLSYAPICTSTNQE